jgi:hypothetical protein
MKISLYLLVLSGLGANMGCVNHFQSCYQIANTDSFCLFRPTIISFAVPKPQSADDPKQIETYRLLAKASSR